MEAALVGEDQVVHPGVGTVEHAEAHPLGGDGQVGVVGAVDEDVVAQNAEGALQRVAVEGAVGRELLVLQDQREVVDAVVAGQVEIEVLVEDEHPGQAPVDVLSRGAVGMRVIPGGGGGLVDRPVRRPDGARLDGLVRTAVHPGRQAHAVPVHGADLGEPVVYGHLDLVAAAGAQGRAEEASVEAPGGRLLAGEDRRPTRLHGQLESPYAVPARLGVEQRGHPQGIAEIEGGRARRGSGVRTGATGGREARQGRDREESTSMHGEQTVVIHPGQG
nr:hypothetical protein [Microbispora sp. GKU 823]